ncbi:MAG TPA: DUF1460 domain-containing protein [Ignavibacteria bacterium]|nr:DUF1460 domain-containing protein [Ignavibacteria bacterium]
MKKIIIYFAFCSIFLSLSIYSVYSLEINDDYEDMKCKKILAKLDLSDANKSISELMIITGSNFLGTEYVGGTLDKNTNSENLVVYVTGLDCVTFIENALVMSRLLKNGKTDFDSYKKELTKIRYRNGVIDGYPSRLHYFTDWIFDNQQKGIVEDITKEIGGKPYNKTIDFMTTHIDSYPQLKNNSENVRQMKVFEDLMNAREMFYIPKSEVDKYYDKLQSGDIIATTTDIGGLDVTHTGLIYKDENGNTRFMHANIKTKEVMITNEELKEYLMGNKKQTGIIVARPVNIEN